MADFKLYYPKLKRFEGGYVNDRDDLGGETYAGITRKNFPKWKGWEIVDKHLPLGRNAIVKDERLAGYVEQFYKETFWDVVGGDRIEEQATAERIADFGVNAGQGRSIKQLQEVLGMEPTGKITPELIEAINNPAKYLLK